MESSFVTAHEIAELKAVVPHIVSDSTKSFALSLIAQFEKGKMLSPKQAFYVRKLAQTPAPSTATAVAEDISPMVAMIQRAKSKIKYPKLHLHCAQVTGGYIRVSVATERSKEPGSLVIRAEQGYAGRVGLDGVYRPVSTFDNPLSEEKQKAITEALAAFAAKPVETARAFGHLSGHCCFCMKRLDDARSTEVGYGPVCASNYGLPWG